MPSGNGHGGQCERLSAIWKSNELRTKPHQIRETEDDDVCSDDQSDSDSNDGDVGGGFIFCSVKPTSSQAG